VATSHRLGAPVLAWTVNDPPAVRRLAVLGVDAIVSDDPGMAREVLATLNRP
jgi:glycerophosphoryl diester phosphodiesterase